MKKFVILSKSVIALILTFIIFGQSLFFANEVNLQQQPQPEFDVQKLAEGVYAVIRRDVPGLWFNPNNVFIIGDKDVIVVDSNISSASTKDILAALKKLTNKPVKYVINTHWHEDHIIGNRVWRDVFPGVEFIAHESTLKDLPAIGLANRKQAIEGVPGLTKLLKNQIEKKKDLSGNDLTEEGRISYEHDIKILEQYTLESSNFQTVMPTITVKDKLTLKHGKRIIDIKYLGRAHTAADLVIHLPNEGILITGDLIVFPVPLVGSTSFPIEYVATLEKLLSLKHTILVPGHGPVMRDDLYAKQLIQLLTSIKQQTESAITRGETLEQTRKSVNLDELKKQFAGDSPVKGFIFDNYVTSSGVAAAYKEATTKDK